MVKAIQAGPLFVGSMVGRQLVVDPRSIQPRRFLVLYASIGRAHLSVGWFWPFMLTWTVVAFGRRMANH